MNIVITNVYCYLNKGDAGIVISMLENIQKIAPGSKIKIISLYPEIDLGKYDPNVEVIAPPIPVDNEQKGIRKIWRNFNLFYKLKRNLKKGRLGEAEKVIKDSDLVISCGGGYMQSFNLKHFWSNFIYHYAQLYVARYYNKPYYIFAQTVGPFSKITKKLVSSTINEATAVLAREKVSYDYVKKNFNNKNTVLTSDVAFLLDPKPTNYLVNNDRKSVGLTLREWHFPNHPNANSLMSTYEKTIVKFVDWLVSQNYSVYIMPQCIGPDTDDDLIVSKRVYSSINNKKNVKIVDEDLTPGQLKYLYGKMDYFVGTRMHSNIFSLGEDVPCLAISYDPKTDGIMALFGLSDYVVDINSINFKELVQKFDKLVDNEANVKKKISSRLISIQQDARKNFEMVLNYEKD
ncbi:polysaccharide pyruvyl transferase family protein [Lactobacillus equicursoris]|uniref:polysaccharide pyruvyl transferase family protein n=1 Tax=Lactobacillus equicursoris TaxID=420645 RepID=UPI0039925BDB